MRDRAAVSRRESFPPEACEPRRLVRREIDEVLMTHGLELELVDVADIRGPRRGLADLQRVAGSLDVPRVVVAAFDPRPAEPNCARAR